MAPKLPIRIEVVLSRTDLLAKIMIEAALSMAYSKEPKSAILTYWDQMTFFTEPGEFNSKEPWYGCPCVKERDQDSSVVISVKASGRLLIERRLTIDLSSVTAKMRFYRPVQDMKWKLHFIGCHQDGSMPYFYLAEKFTRESALKEAFSCDTSFFPNGPIVKHQTALGSSASSRLLAAHLLDSQF